MLRSIQKIVKFQNLHQVVIGSEFCTRLCRLNQNNQLSSAKRCFSGNNIETYSNKDSRLKSTNNYFAKSLEFYIYIKDVDKVYDCLRKARMQNPKFKLTPLIVIKFTILLVRRGYKWPEIEKLLIVHQQSNKPYCGDRMRNVMIELRDTLRQSNDIELESNVYEALYKYKYLTNELKFTIIEHLHLNTKLKELHDVVYNEKDPDQAYKVWKALDCSVVPGIDLLTNLIKLFNAPDRFEQQTELILHALKSNQSIYQTVLQGYLKRIAEDRRFDIFEKIDQATDAKQKADMEYHTFYVRAFLYAKQPMVWLRRYAANVERSTNKNELHQLRITFPRNTHVQILKEFPESLDEFENLALRIFDKSIGPLVVLWYHLFTTDSPRANELWQTHFQGYPKRQQITFICGNLCYSKDEIRLKRLSDLVKFEPESSRGAVYAAMLGLYVDNNQLNEALRLMDEIVASFSLQFIDRRILIRLKSELELVGRRFPFSIDEMR